MRRALVAILFTLAVAAACAGQTPARQSKSAQPKPPQSSAEAARQELNLGARLYRAGKVAEAEQHFRRALELDPEGKATRLNIARIIHQQYKPGDMSPENIAAGERAVAAYADILARDPTNEDAYKATIFIYGQMKRDDRVVEILMQRGNDFSLPNAQRADAFVTLASRHWQCSYDLTERKENKTTESQPDKTPVIRYKMPGDAGDFIRARQCVTDGLQFAEQAASLAPKSATAWNFKANLLREAAKLAEMEGDAAGKAEYERQSAEALETQRRASGVAPASVVAESADGTAPSAQPEQWKKLAVMGGVLNGKAIHKPMPPYPAEAIAAGVQGTVTVRIMVDEAGRVTEAEAISGPELLRAAAVTAARNSRYAPTQLSGQPVKVSGVITYDFVLQRN